MVLNYSRERYIPMDEKIRLKSYIFASIRGMDVLQELLDDTSITEIMVNGTDDIFVERGGALNRQDICFDTREKLDDLVQKIAAGSNRIINEEQK